MIVGRRLTRSAVTSCVSEDTHRSCLRGIEVFLGHRGQFNSRLLHQVRVKVSPEEVAQKQQDEMFKDVLLYRMVQKIPVKNQHLRTIIASLIFIGVIISPKLIGKAKKKGEGYLDMELPDDVVEAREKQGRQAQQQ